MADEETAEQGGGAAVAEGSLLEQIMEQTRLNPAEEGYDVTLRGVKAFISELLSPEREFERVDKSAVDMLVAARRDSA